jgi:hypothetical protein
MGKTKVITQKFLIEIIFKRVFLWIIFGIFVCYWVYFRNDIIGLYFSVNMQEYKPFRLFKYKKEYIKMFKNNLLKKKD